MRVQIAMGPMCGRRARLKHLFLQLPVLRRHPRRGCTSRIHKGADQIQVSKLGPVKLSGVPEDEIARLGADLDEFAALGLEPVEVLLGEWVEVLVFGCAPGGGTRDGILNEEVLPEWRGAFHHD